MNEPNPYAAPRSEVADVQFTGETATLNRVASGQRLMIYSVLVSMGAMALRTALGPPAAIVSLVASVVAIAGVARLSGALGSGIAMRIVYCIAMIIPLMNLLVMLLLSARATRALRAGGYQVGLLGARQRQK
jgi:hypothetical protein